MTNYIAEEASLENYPRIAACSTGNDYNRSNLPSPDFRFRPANQRRGEERGPITEADLTGLEKEGGRAEQRHQQVLGNSSHLPRDTKEKEREKWRRAPRHF